MQTLRFKNPKQLYLVKLMIYLNPLSLDGLIGLCSGTLRYHTLVASISLGDTVDQPMTLAQP